MASPEDAKFHSGWSEWLISNLVVGSNLENILEVMRQSGFSDEYAEARLRESIQNSVVKAARDAVAVQRKAADILNALSKLEHKSPFSKQVDVVWNLPAADFYREYFFKNRPVLLQGVISKWKAVGLWTPEHFASRFGDCQVEVTTGRESDPRHEYNLDQHRRQMPMRDYVRLVVDGGETNDYYLVAQNYLLARPEFHELYDHITDVDGYLVASEMQGHVRVWFGPKGTITRLHHDAAPVLMAQIYGRKQVKLISPVHLSSVSSDGDWLSSLDLDHLDYFRFPKMQNVDVLEVTLAPGELLFVPLGWWHWVKALDVSISVSLDNFCVRRNEIEMDWKR
ncbi:MAG TPA: cupin-like domain-containing protein [Candidatus Angelobacter sp.]|nr:cupin-like domain-containing protein [Candidatus Angelobacter sp.]